MSNAISVHSRPPIVRTRFWKSFATLTQEIQQGFESHGDVIELRGFPYRVYCLRSPDHIEVVMKHPVVGSSKCPSVFGRLRALMPKSAVVQPGGTIWTDKRQKVQACLTNEAIARYAAITIDRTTQMLDERWDRYANEGMAFDVYEQIQKLLTRIGLQIFFSEDISGNELELLHKQFSVVESEFARRLPPILPTKKDAEVRKISLEIRRFMLQLIAKRRLSSTRPDDLLSLLLDDGNAADEGQNDMVVDQMIELFTSVRLCAPPLGLGMRMIAEHKEVQDRLVAEVGSVAGGRRLTFGDVGVLKYHHMVVSEIFRLYPSAVALPRWCKDGMELLEYSIPPRSIVAPMIYHTHRNPSVYPDPEKFTPDRWHPDAHVSVPTYARLGFGHGKRTCPGMPLALMIIRTIIASISQRYHIQLAGDEWMPGEVELKIHPSRRITMQLRSNDLPESQNQTDQIPATPNTIRS